MIDQIVDWIEEYKSKGKEVYIYGAGTYGKGIFRLLIDNRKDNIITGFVVTQSSNNTGECLGKPIFELQKMDLGVAAFILAMNENNAESVRRLLEERGIKKENYKDARPLIEHSGSKRGMKNGSVEITTNIGCSVNCRYCPQKLLLSKYFEKDKTRASQMSVDTFKKVLGFFPNTYDISFGGMSEPFLNPKTIEMIRYACERGRYVAVYTTLVGLDKNSAEELLTLPINWITLHVADKYGYANIPTTKDYYDFLELFIHAKKMDGSSYVNMCNAQATPDEHAADICRGQYEILTEMTDRAGNLKDESLIQNNLSQGRIICGNSSKGELNSNIVLPDGTVVLCCMDYGLQHVLGNIYKNSFEEIMNGDMMNFVISGMNGDITKSILCRTCSMAHCDYRTKKNLESQ